jgi:regulatory protein
MSDINPNPIGLATLISKVQAYCAYQDRCSSEVIQKLKGWGVDENRIPKIIEALVKDKFIDDRRFAETFAISKFRLKKWGRNKIAYELRLKKITAEMIVHALDSIDENEYAETIRSLIGHKAKEIKDKDVFLKNQKIARFLISKGFEAERVFAVLNAKN